MATPNDDGVHASLIPAGGVHGFLANISIGTPTIQQPVLIDTASNLLWFQCLPCTTCFKQCPPLFDPSKLLTYSNTCCDSLACLLSRSKCDPNHDEYCTYEMSYVDESSTAGNLASEQATFKTSNEGTVKVPIEVLGCGHVNKNTRDVQERGVLGLSYGYYNALSLVKQLGSTFFYCIGNIHEPQYRYKQLILGDGDHGRRFCDLEGQKGFLQCGPPRYKRRREDTTHRSTPGRSKEGLPVKEE
ncbi:hypothetical protein NL676_031147 [Syzygium grande]|nr:hypothetical protein NL676_031147 [Syzygium grande]